MVQFKTSFVKLIPCRFFPEFLKEGVFLVTSNRKQVLRIKEKNDSNDALLENKNREVIRIDKLNESNEMFLIFLVNGKIDYLEPEIIFNIDGNYSISGVFDLLGDEINSADVIDAKPDEIGNRVRKYGDYRQWESELGLKAHQAYYWVDRIMVIDESIIREDGYPERKYVTEYTNKEFNELSKGWEEILDPLDFYDIEKIIIDVEVQIETKTVESDGDIPLKFEHPFWRGGKCMICLD